MTRINITIKELQDSINRRLERFSGEKFDSRKSGIPEYHRWYMDEIASELEGRGVDIFRPSTWWIVADIDGPGEIKVSSEEVADVKVEMKRDKRFASGGPGTILSIRVNFREELQDLTVEGARVFLLKADLENRLAYYRGERERLAAELNATADKIADLAAITIEEAAE